MTPILAGAERGDQPEPEWLTHAKRIVGMVARGEIEPPLSPKVWREKCARERGKAAARARHDRKRGSGE